MYGKECLKCEPGASSCSHCEIFEEFNREEQNASIKKKKTKQIVKDAKFEF